MSSFKLPWSSKNPLLPPCMAKRKSSWKVLPMDAGLAIGLHPGSCLVLHKELLADGQVGVHQLLPGLEITWFNYCLILILLEDRPTMTQKVLICFNYWCFAEWNVDWLHTMCVLNCFNAWSPDWYANIAALYRRVRTCPTKRSGRAAEKKCRTASLGIDTSHFGRWTARTANHRSWMVLKKSEMGKLGSEYR